MLCWSVALKTDACMIKKSVPVQKGRKKRGAETSITGGVTRCCWKGWRETLLVCFPTSPLLVFQQENQSEYRIGIIIIILVHKCNKTLRGEELRREERG